MAQLQSSSITGSLIISSSGTDSTTNSLLVTNGAGYEYLKVTDGGTVDVRQSLIVNHATNANRSLRFSWGSIFATDTNNELTLGSVYTDNNATRIKISGKNSDNSPSDAISMQANNGVAIYSGSSSDHFDPQALLHVSGGGIFTGDLDVTGSLHVLGDLTVGKISNQSELVDVGGNFNFDTVAEPTSAERTNFSSSIISSAGNVDNGTHYYHVIYKTSDGGETGAYGTPFLAATITDNTTAGQVELTGIPTSSDARVTARDIYRSEANGSQYYGKKLATISDNTTTTYTDNLADSSLDQTTLFYRKANSTAGYFYKDNNLFAQAGNAHYTSFGVGALDSVTIGQDNVAFGGSALQNTTSGRENTAIGYSSGVNNTTGYGNTYLGYVAGYFNETGVKNTAVGGFALRQATLTSTSYNTAVGHSALWKLTGNNNHNTAIGHAAGQGYQGLSNIHIGSYAGYKSTEGSGGDYNINIGYSTGNDTTGDNNILIGRELEAPNSGSSNQLNIGNLIYATGLGSGTTQSTGNVGIGTTSPSQKFHVEGTSLFAGQGTWPMRMENNVASGNAEMSLWTVTDAYAATKILSLVATPINNQPVWYFQASGTGWQNMTLQRYGGQVGIRTLEPSANLTVQGGGTTTGKTFLAQDSNASALFTILDNGNVGIGTTSPSDKLTVEGAISASGNIYTKGALLLDGVDGLHLNQGGASVFSPTPGIFYSGISGQGWYFQVPNNGQEKFSFKLGGTSAGREFRVVDPSWNSLFQVQGTGDAIIANNLTVGGTVTAQEFHTEFISASIVYQSGSTKFGDTSDDTHSFTGSIGILSGSLTLDGPTPLLYLKDSTLDTEHRINSNNTELQIKGDQAIEMFTNNTSAIYIASDGDVGIGTDNPLAGLEVANAENSTLRLTRSSNNGNYLQLQGGSSGAIYNINTSGTQDHIFQTGGNEKMRLTSAGNIGIGTTSPAEKLHVSGGELRIDAATTNQPALEIRNTTGNITAQLSNLGSPSYGILYLYNNGAAHTNSTGAKVASAGSSYFNGGNVGIGTTSPQYPLHINNGTGDQSALFESTDVTNTISIKDSNSTSINTTGIGVNADDLFLYAGTTGYNQRIRIQGSTGNVGIGTTSPSYKLQVNGTARFGDGSPYLKVTSTSVEVEGSYLLAGYQSGVSFYAYESVFRGLIRSDSSGGNALKLGDTAERMRIVDGNVGIGTTTPPHKVSSQVSADGNYAYYAANSLGSNRGGIYIDSSGNTELILRTGAGQTASIKASGSSYLNGGNVGIGTTSPVALLTLEGAVGGDPMLRLKNTGTATSEDAYMAFNRDNTNNQGYTIGLDSGDNSFKISEDGDSIATNNRLTILTGGNVGIGTTSPQKLLDVNGDVRFKRNIYGADGNYIGFFTDGGSALPIKVASLTISNNYSDTAPNYGLYVKGNAGIGTTSPSEKLEVRDGYILVSGSSTSHGFELARDGNDTYQIRHLDGGLTIFNSTDARKEMTFKGDGFIGIGTTAPTSTLHVSGTADVFLIEGSGSTANTSIFAIDGNNGRLFEVSDDLSDSLFSVNTIAGLPVMEVFSDNRVIMGAFNQNDLVISGSKVGIGTDSPSYKLDVSGSINHAGASYIVPATTSGASGATTVLTGATFDNATLIKASHDGVTTGDYTLELPAASSSTNRTIRIISDSSTDANHNIIIAPTSGDTLDGGASGFTINRNYEGLMVWSDGTEWFIIQSKNV